MIQTLLLDVEVVADIREAELYYERKRAGLGAEFLVCLNEALDRIRIFPESGAPEFKDTRRVPIRKFPYAVFYYLEPDLIKVFAVCHLQRSESRWKSRL